MATNELLEFAARAHIHTFDEVAVSLQQMKRTNLNERGGGISDIRRQTGNCEGDGKVMNGRADAQLDD